MNKIWYKNRPFFVKDDNIYVIDFYECRQSIIKYVFQNNVMEHKYEWNEYKKINGVDSENIWIKDGNLTDLSGSSNIININDRYFCIFHKRTFDQYNCEEIWKNEEQFGLISHHPIHKIIYFSYFSELILTDKGFRFKSISCPIYIKKDCFNGIHYVCGLTYDTNNSIYISYGINDLDSGILIYFF